jgi:hypothetical protein
MKKHIIIFTIAILVVSFGVVGAGVQKFGKEFSLKESMKISDLLGNADSHLNKPVRVEGTIVGVCAHMGCWMDLASDKEFQKLRIKVKDGDMVFPLTAKGKHAVVEGALYKIQLSKEQTIKMKKHECQQKGEKFDPSCVQKGEVIYQLKPTAVVIKD